MYTICETRVTGYLSHVKNCSHAKFLLKSDNPLRSYGQNYFQYGGHPPSWIYKIFIFGHMTVIEFQIFRVYQIYQDQMIFRRDVAI